MADDPVLDALRRNLAFLLEETFASPARPGGNAYLDRQSGWEPTLASLSARGGVTACADPAERRIAGHVEHARLYLEALLRFADGRPEKVDWDATWGVREVTPVAWEALKASFEETSARVVRAFEDRDTWDDHAIGAAMAVLAHSAYHLGAVRQRLAATADLKTRGASATACRPTVDPAWRTTRPSVLATPARARWWARSAGGRSQKPHAAGPGGASDGALASVHTLPLLPNSRPAGRRSPRRGIAAAHERPPGRHHGVREAALGRR